MRIHATRSYHAIATRRHNRITHRITLGSSRLESLETRERWRLAAPPGCSHFALDGQPSWDIGPVDLAPLLIPERVDPALAGGDRLPLIQAVEEYVPRLETS